MDIGLIAGSMKPFHILHMRLVQTASDECDQVVLFVSLSTRARPGELPVYGDDMKTVWDSVLLSLMPSNVDVRFNNNPIKGIFTELTLAKNEGRTDRFKIFSDPDDIDSTYGPVEFNSGSPVFYSGSKIYRYFPEMIDMGLIVPRYHSDRSVSGTDIRKAVVNDDYETFKRNMVPETVDITWKLLRSHVDEMKKPSEPKKTVLKKKK